MASSPGALWPHVRRPRPSSPRATRRTTARRCELPPSCGANPVRDGSHWPRKGPAPAAFDGREAPAQVCNFRRELLPVLIPVAEQGVEMSGLGAKCLGFGVELHDVVHERERLSRMPRRYL